jgi:hypothetical protein
MSHMEPVVTLPPDVLAQLKTIERKLSRATTLLYDGELDSGRVLVGAAGYALARLMLAIRPAGEKGGVGP